MYKRIISIVLSIILCVHLVPSAWAADERFGDELQAPVETPEEYGNRIVYEMRSTDEGLNQFIQQHGCESVQSKSTYFVTEYIAPSDVSTASLASLSSSIRTKVSSFSEYPAEFINQLGNQIQMKTITPPGEYTVDYSVLQVTLSATTGSQTSLGKFYYVRSSFVWLELPDPGYFTNLDGVIGLAFNPQLTIIGGTSSGKFTYSRYSSPGGGSVTNQTQDVVIDIPENTYSVGATFSFTHQMGSGLYNYLTAFSGYIGCKTYKSNEYDQYCSALAIYEDVNLFGLLSDEVSISFPAGVSFPFGAIHTPYNVQDAIALIV